MYESKAYVLKLWFHHDQQPSSSTMEQHAVVLVQWPVVHCQFSRVSYAAHPKILNYIHNAVLWKLFCHHCCFVLNELLFYLFHTAKLRRISSASNNFHVFLLPLLRQSPPFATKRPQPPFFCRKQDIQKLKTPQNSHADKAASYRERFRVQSSRFCPQIDTDYHRFYYFPPAALNSPSS